MMKKIFSRSFMVVALVTVVGFVSSCKDYNDEIMADYRGADKELGDLIENLDDLISDLTTKHNQDIEAAKQAREQMQTTLEGLINTVQANQALKDKGQSDSIKGAYDSIKDLENAISKHSDSIKWAVDSIGKLDARINTLGSKVEALEELKAGERLDSLEGDVKDLEEIVNAWVAGIGDSTSIADWIKTKDTDITTLQNDIATAKGSHESVAKRLESIEKSIAGIDTCSVDCEALETWVNETKPILTELKDVTSKNSASIESLTTDFKLFRAVYNKKVKELTDSINSVKAAYQAADQILADSIAELRSDLTELEGRVKANEEAIDSIFGRLDALEEDVEDLKDGIKNRISSVLVQGAYSPVVGYFNIPFGIKSNILAAYKGEVIEPMNFPFGYIDGKINELIPLKSSLGYAGEEIEELAHGCAGKLYLTINPAEVNLDSVDFALVNSQNELAPVKFDSVVVSSDVLKFGYTRAGAPLYEASAHITDFNAASLDLNLGDYKDILSDLKNGQMSLSDITNTLYSSINDIADANAVRASWTDSLGEHSVYSDFAVAAVAVKPLAFTFLQDLNLQSVPGFTRVQNFIDKAFDKVNIALPSFDGLNFTAPEIKKIAIKDFDELGVNTEIIITDVVEYTLNMEVPVEDVVMDDLSGTTDKITVTVPAKTHSVIIDGVNQQLTIPAYTIEVPASNFTVDGPTVKIKNVKINKVLEIPFTVKYDMKDIVEDLYGSVTEPIEDVNEMLGDLEDFMDDVNAMLDELKKVQDLEQSITDAVDGIKGQLNSYLDKLNNKLCNALNSINDKLQPAMFVKTINGFGMLSQAKSMPTVIENGAVLVPTTYTAELLAPASKKYVAITAVDGATDGLAAVNTGDLNKVLEGNVRTVEFNGQAGKTYELTYAALDYVGNVATVKYYVKVK